MKRIKHTIRLPIGKAALVVAEINLLRDQCCKAAEQLIRKKPLDEMELEECARLDDGLAEADRILKSTVAAVTISRLKRRSRAR